MESKILIVDDKKEYLQTAMQYIIEDSIPYAMLCAPKWESWSGNSKEGIARHYYHGLGNARDGWH